MGHSKNICIFRKKPVTKRLVIITLSCALASKKGNNAHIRSFATDPRKPPCQSIKIAWRPAHSRSINGK